MNFEKIKDDAERRFTEVGEHVAKQLTDRLAVLVEALRPQLKIESVHLSMGTWSVSGPDFPIEYDDGSQSEQEPQEIFYWLESRKIWKPIGLDDKHVAILREMSDMLEWWTLEPYVPSEVYHFPTG